MPIPPLFPAGDRPPADVAVPAPVLAGLGPDAQPEPIPPSPAETGELLVAPPMEQSDDSPTIISRMPPRPVLTDGKNTDLHGQRLAHFELLEPIGVGGMAAVIRARDLQLDRCVALKILPPEMANDPENVLRFQREARAAARLDHEHIARVYFCGEDQSLHFIAFEFVEGENLRTIIDRRGPLPVRDGIHYLLQIATGLVHAAERGVIHRDIKPSNIIISPNGRAKMVDMGLARSLETPASGDLTHSGVTLGTFDYISPEQAMEPREADIRSDIYSLGCTFYHALTGQPPVPEGTAAKKLHHHQSVLPLDPRQLNPAIPDEVAAILGRMMAKDPKDRYQHPEELVQHLMAVAQKLGVGPESSSGVLYIEAPLPGPPRARPVLVAVLAAAALVALIVLLGQRTPEPAPPGAAPDSSKLAVANQSPPKDDGGRKPDDRGPNPAPVTVGPLQPPEPAAKSFTVRGPDSLKGLAAWLAQEAKEYTIYLACDLNLTADEAPAEGGARPVGLVFTNKVVHILPAPELVDHRPKITLSPPTQPVNTDLLAALTVNGGSVEVRGVQFEIDAGGGPQQMAAIRCRGGSTRVIGCDFRQAHPHEKSKLRDVQVDPDPEARSPGKTVVSLSRCLFLGVGYKEEDKTAFARSGQTALAIAGAARVSLADCAFGPHAAEVAVEPPGGASDLLQVRLSRCSALLNDDTAVFQLAGLKGCKLEVEQCLFSRPLPPADAEPVAVVPGQGAVLIRQTGASTDGDLKYEGADNRYHNLAAFWVKQQFERWEPETVSWESFRERVETDKNSQWLKDSPWESPKDLLALLDGEPNNVREAFRVNLRSLALRQQGDGTLGPVGAGSSPWDDLPLYKAKEIPALRKPDAVVGKKQRVVNPAVKEAGNGVYPNLLTAISDAGPDDLTILIKHNGELPVAPIPLEKPNLNLTIRPFEGYHPVLTLGETTEPNAALFRLHNGKLHLEGLRFHLHPKRDEFKSQSVVTLAGDGECTFQECVLTLEPGQGVPQAAVTLADPATVMKMDRGAASQVATLSFEKCFVRGDGDLLAVRASRPLALTVSNTLAALTGSLLTVEAAREDPTPAVSDPAINVTLSQTTAYLRRYLLYLKAGTDLKGLLQVRFDTSTCLFVAADQASALVHLDGPDTKREKWNKLLAWHPDHNAYVNFSQMLDQQPGGGQMAMEPYNSDDWKQFTGEDVTANRVKLLDPVPAEIRLHEVLPERFKLKSDTEPAPDFGARLDKLPLPRP
jgi:serine/threonine protein kinase